MGHPCSSSTSNPVYTRRVDSSGLVFNLNFSSINLVSIFRYSSSSSNPVYVRHVNSSYLGSSHSLSSHRQSYIGLVFISRYIDLIINNFLIYRSCLKLSLSWFMINKTQCLYLSFYRLIIRNNPNFRSDEVWHRVTTSWKVGPVWHPKRHVILTHHGQVSPEQDGGWPPCPNCSLCFHV
jgi:hypothetical protein